MAMLLFLTAVCLVYCILERNDGAQGCDIESKQKIKEYQQLLDSGAISIKEYKQFMSEVK